ncbi:NADH:flavin oxidoreductase/NADH oxidase family protein [Algoriphagus namhaensis]|uniref:NADH:flavin oxidoreductase/NADH oxidase family protein n=1 Tax=Algoriphagus namhaensis TaxID=915353 RepID=A0ABV8APT9_9BACT
MINLNSSITLPCGAVLTNRLAKAPMTERMSNAAYEPIPAHEHLYRIWSETGSGLLITGNVMIDKDHMESAGNVFFGDEAMIPKLKAWTAAGTVNGNHLWAQISHSGRQTNRFVNPNPKAPSQVQLNKLLLFGKPVAMTHHDIEKVIVGFRRAAKIAKASGFTGIQIHAAHGYLLSQFLSPLTNRRTDEWGGSLENRSRLLLEIVKECREEVGNTFPISVKLNSSDFQRGGFTESDSLEVVKKLSDAGIDLLEVSGGTYEKVAFFLGKDEKTQKESTKKREAYFLDFAKQVREISTVPLMITGGFRSYDFCNEVLASGECDLIGMGRPFIGNCDRIADFMNGKVSYLENPPIRTGFKAFEDAAEAGYYARQLINIAEGRGLKANLNPIACSMFIVTHEFKKAREKKNR